MPSGKRPARRCRSMKHGSPRRCPLQRSPRHLCQSRRALALPTPSLFLLGMGRASIGATRSPSRPSMGVWDVRSGERVRALAGHPGMVYAVAWSPTGTVLVSGGGDGMLRWWDVERGECAQVRLAHQGTVQRLQVSPDGSRLASCGDDGAIHVWELESGEHLRMLRRDRPYERLDITGIRGVTEAQKASLRALGAIEDAPSSVLFKRSGHPGRRFSL